MEHPQYHLEWLRYYIKRLENYGDVSSPEERLKLVNLGLAECEQLEKFGTDYFIISAPSKAELLYEKQRLGESLIKLCK